MADELKPCPFCGGPAILTEGPHHDPEGCTWEVSCDDCGAQNRCLPTPQAARDAWNTRAQAPSTSGADEREEIARIMSRIEEERKKAASYPLGDPMCSRHGGIRDGLKEALEIILARQGPGPGEAVAWRPEVVAFANLMEAQLRANDHKGGWRGDTAAALHNRLLEEAEELFDALNWRSAFLGDADPERIGSEAADVANFAMMIADVCGALAATPTREG